MSLPVPAHIRATLALGLPLIGSNLAQMSLHVSNSVMMGRYGVPELAATVLGASTFFVTFILGAGFANAVLPMVASALGRGDEAQVRRDTRMGLWLSIAYGVAVLPIFWFSGTLLGWAGQEPQVAALAQDYLRISGFGMFAALTVMVLKSYLSALGRTQVVLWSTLTALGVNVAVGFPLIFGLWGLPEMGVRGAAIASLAVQALNVLVLGIYAAFLPELRRFELFSRFWRPDWPALVQVARLGAPIGFTGLAEASLFQATALMMGWIGTVELAAHGIALEVAALSYMIHLGLASAATIRVARYHGAGLVEEMRVSAWVAIGLSCAVGVAVVGLYLGLPAQIIGLFLTDGAPDTAAIIAYGTGLLALAAAFQFGDAMQAVALGLLRALKDTRTPMIIAIISYWVVGLPTGYLLGFHVGWGGYGLWTGLVLGLGVAAAALMLRFWMRAPR
ncbi:MATE family efflux transporter [Falsirhodobacter halotolerans]|uniref:MATE family efflux transporter n=1 Tax=Falsirhodobacter halotolerans TaxID=1146892 RepID=UPI001FD36D99|nr:MATE family efflux transporter [Falsirhodobacter halotolerans]MCJ8138880.1 MATE family efflux transporter [Falsirhodobacter halotolerans]